MENTKLERRRKGQDAKYKVKKKAQALKDLNDFIKNQMRQRKLDARITRKFEKGKKGKDMEKSKQIAYNKRITLGVLSRVKKSKTFALIEEEMDFLPNSKGVEDILELGVKFM